MAHASKKISNFPILHDSQLPSAPISDDPLEDGQDPTQQVRNLIEQLQESTREARQGRREAEEECERLRHALAAQEVQAELVVANDPSVKALIRERDLLAEQQSQYGPVIGELKQKLKAFETENAEATRTRDEALRAQKEARRELESAHRANAEAEGKRDEALHQRDAAIRQLELRKGERESSDAKIAELTKTLADARKALAAAKKGDPDLANQIASLRQARDGMGVQVADLKRRVSELEDEAAELTYAREAAEKAAREAHAQLEELRKNPVEHVENGANPEKIAQLEAALEESRKMNAALQEETAGFSETQEQMSAEIEDLFGRLSAATADRDANALGIEEERALHLATQKQIEELIRNRDENVRELSDRVTELEASLGEQFAEAARLKEELETTTARLAEEAELRGRYEQRRLDVIELNARLENAHREIRDLSASLAESRLLAKSAAKKAGLELSHLKGRSGSAQRNEDDPERKATLAAMRRCFQSFYDDQAKPEFLDELETHTSSLGNSARDNGQPVLHRVAVALAALVADLRQVQDQICEAALNTVNQGIEFIASLTKNPEIETTVNLGQARVYVVDDHPTTCELVADGMSTVGLQTYRALSSSEAVAELAGNRYDLIILDVNLPDLDGFELCSHIRNMALHPDTPVFFISGHASLENRVKSSLRGGSEFLGKPFNIQDLALKALMSVISSQLRIR